MSKSECILPPAVDLTNYVLTCNMIMLFVKSLMACFLMQCLPCWLA